MLTEKWSLLKNILPALLLGAVPAHGMIYMWKDSAGIAHYTNKEYDVPARYKAKAKAMYPEASDAGTVQPGNAAASAAPPVQPAPPPVTVNQNTKPATPPDVRPAPPPAQVTNIPPKTPERRGRRQRERDDE